MSDNDALVTALDVMQEANYCIVAVLALLVYDHLLTFSGEVQFIWGRKFSGATVVFTLNRYVTLLGKIALPVSVLWWPRQTDQVSFTSLCAPPVVLVMIFTVIAYFVAAIFSALRVYAIWGKDWRPFALVLLVALVVPVSNMYQYIISVPAVYAPPLYGCGESIDLSTTEFYTLSLITHTCAIATDVLVVILTWIKTYQIKRVASGLHLKTSFSTLILRDGTLYFVVLLLLNVIDLTINRTNALFNPLPIFIDVFTCILISRFMLNLREVSRTTDRHGDRSTTTIALSQFSSLHIATPDLVGDLGSPLNYTDWTATTAVPVIDVPDSRTFADASAVNQLEKGGPLWAGLLEESMGQISDEGQTHASASISGLSKSESESV